MVSSSADCPSPRWHRVLLPMLPSIRRYARNACRHHNPDVREEFVQAVVCNVCSAVARLAELGKLDLCYPSVLARFGIAQVKDGRMTGGHLNCKDISSRYCQRLKGVVVERLDHFDEEDNAWAETIVEDKTAGPFDIVRTKLDVADFFDRLPRRTRRIAQFLSLGNRTADAARKFGVSQGRVSQLRRELAASWKTFTDDNEANAA